MTFEQWLIGAVVALGTTVSTIGGGAIRYLLKEIEVRDAKCEKRLASEAAECSALNAKLEAKLDGAGDLMFKQAEAMQRQIDAQQQMIIALQTALASGQSS